MYTLDILFNSELISLQFIQQNLISSFFSLAFNILFFLNLESVSFLQLHPTKFDFIYFFLFDFSVPFSEPPGDFGGPLPPSFLSASDSSAFK
jgi:hypothetical protein